MLSRDTCHLPFMHSQIFGSIAFKFVAYLSVCVHDDTLVILTPFSSFFLLSNLKIMDCWSPLDAMKAYMHTLKLCKDSCNQDCTRKRPTAKLVKHECMEFIAALAAGNKARLLLDIAPGGTSASTLALAIAARHARGRLVCVRREREALEEIKDQLEAFDHGDVCELKCGEPCDVIEQYKNIDFAVVDHRMKECVELLFAMDMNPNGSVVVVSNLFDGRRVRSTPFGQMMRGKGSGNKTAILPIGGGMEITRIIGNDGRRRVRKSCKRTFMVYEECPKFHVQEV